MPSQRSSRVPYRERREGVGNGAPSWHQERERERISISSSFPSSFLNFVKRKTATFQQSRQRLFFFFCILFSCWMIGSEYNKDNTRSAAALQQQQQKQPGNKRGQLNAHRWVGNRSRWNWNWGLGDTLKGSSNRSLFWNRIEEEEEKAAAAAAAQFD